MLRTTDVRKRAKLMTHKEHQTFKILTYGCQMNEHDSGVMEEILTGSGLEPAKLLDDADVILINTCCVRERAEDRQKGRIASLKQYKTRNRGVVIGVCGCIAQKDREELFEQLPHVDFVLGPQAIRDLPQVLESVRSGTPRVCGRFDDRGTVITGARTRKGDVTAYVTIMKGCDNYCSYCIVPFVRGRAVSRQPAGIIAELEDLAATGVKEVTLLGQNVNAYGQDLKSGITFVGLLKRIDAAAVVSRVRFVTSHPKDFTRELVETVAAGKSLCECFHLPAQAGSNRVLSAMRRGYTREEYLEKTEWIRTLIPSSSISTDLIVGFPGETEQEFQETVSLVETVRFERSHTFYYSPRSGTTAARLSGLLPLEERKVRLRELVETTNRTTAGQSSALSGSVLEVLVEGPSKKDPAKQMGRTRSDAIVIFEHAEPLTGQLVMVHIDQARPWTLFGHLVDDVG